MSQFSPQSGRNFQFGLPGPSRVESYLDLKLTWLTSGALLPRLSAIEHCSSCFHGLFMELDVPAANDALRSELAYCTGHRDTELVARARLAVVLHRHAEGATVAAGAGEQDRLC